MTYSRPSLWTLPALALFGAAPLGAQSMSRRPIPYPVVVPSEYQRAVARGTRTPSGVPGPAYWQQWTDYTLRARIIPEEKRLVGSGRIIYHNNSPDRTGYVVLQLLQNLHAEGAPRNRPAEVTGGLTLRRVVVDGQLTGELLGLGARLGYGVQGTAMFVRPGRLLTPGDSVVLEIDWTFKIPQRGAGGRMGWSEDNLFHIAYWYPQMAVYDDVERWQADQFLGNAEFYFGFGRYDVTVEVPEGWVVMATGEPQNLEEVLAPAILQRYRRATQSDTVVHVLTEADFGPGVATVRSPAEDGYLTWRFVSDTVRDVAFAAMRASQWDATRTPVGDRDGDGQTDYATINSFWRSSAPRWSQQWRYAQHSIAFLSKWTGFPYPWPHMTSIEGGGIEGGGMEYPMMTLIGPYDWPQATDTSLYGVTAHELAHMWFPMIVGTDERRYSWMDEGTTSFNGGHTSADFYPGADSMGSRGGYIQIARMNREGEIMRLSDYHYPGPAYGTASYAKPATLLNTLRALLGPETFDPIYRKYIRTWAYKHPKPWDFFNFFATESGRKLDWFWRTWYYETWSLDQAVGAVETGEDGTTITIVDRGWAPMPARVTITRENGEKLQREVPVETWLSGATQADITVPPGSPVVRVEIDPDQGFPDIDRRNNVWELRRSG